MDAHQPVMHWLVGVPTFRVHGRWHILGVCDSVARSASHSDGRTSAREATTMHINYDALITDIGCPECDAPLAYEKATGYWVTQCDHDHALTTVEVDDFRAQYDNGPSA